VADFPVVAEADSGGPGPGEFGSAGAGIPGADRTADRVSTDEEQS